MIRTTNITSVTEHRQHLREHLDRVKKTNQPLYITTNGEPEAVVLSPTAFDELIEKVEIAQSLEVLDRSMEDVKAGRGRPLDEAVRQIADELKLKLKR